MRLLPVLIPTHIGVKYDDYTEYRGDRDSGIGGDISYKISDTAATEFRDESYCDTNALMAGFSVNFWFA